ncbi:cell cycle checkpoint control protein RAD9A isoform X4 [Monodelphis domestica]|uniref:cell cycle checkpoint control protein RAD9A isoform X4 n=1 Tax=Monodelphis domestica TaxID=13616 RepID=UPI0024E23C67|nr:cell cycle checkpoint control protein RAD9A isoform X4 [Monodelphis domestica]
MRGRGGPKPGRGPARGKGPGPGAGQGRSLAVAHRRRVVLRATGGRALASHRERIPLGFRLLPVCAAFLPALPGVPAAAGAASALQSPHEVVPVSISLVGSAREDSGALLHRAEHREQPLGHPAPLQARRDQDPQPVLPGVRIPPGRLRPGPVPALAPSPCPGHLGWSAELSKLSITVAGALDRVLVEAVSPFSPALSEVTLGVSRGRRVVFRSYLEEDTDAARAMMTEMSLSEEEFQQLQAQEGASITFCLKEFRGLLSFAESANLLLNIHFDVPGRPAIFSIEDSLLDGHFVLATLSQSDLCSQEPCRPGQGTHSTTHLDDFANDDIDSYMIAMETTVSEGAAVTPRTPSPVSEEEAEPNVVPGTPPLKKFRSLFFGSVLAPTESPSEPNPVLAEDSEGEG